LAVTSGIIPATKANVVSGSAAAGPVGLHERGGAVHPALAQLVGVVDLQVAFFLTTPKSTKKPRKL
jgi:hypothetical protein